MIVTLGLRDVVQKAYAHDAICVLQLEGSNAGQASQRVSEIMTVFRTASNKLEAACAPVARGDSGALTTSATGAAQLGWCVCMLALSLCCIARVCCSAP